ncbi:MAG: GNAT family N-acetyltransferase, partial [Thermoflexales bacterium]|nr:GNAT family N-acetyltransferase [Thermoflexales bacterium]
AALRAVGLPLRGSGWRLRALEGREAAALAPAHAALLADAGVGGASVGYLPPLSDTEGLRYANGVADAVAGGGRVLLAALAGEHLIGAAQLDLSPRQNGRHRAEVAKVLVLRAWRGRGVARSLMLALDDTARRLGRSTLVLDTRAGDPSEALYRGVGWTHIGSIPRYARSASGALHATAFYYKLV